MDDLFKSPGKVETVFARGWLSAWEASRLERGCGLIAETEAGESAELCFNGRWLARGEFVVFADGSRSDAGGPELAGFRITGLEREAREAPERGGGDYLAELLPFELCLGEAAYGLGALQEASVGSILSLDSPIGSGSPILLKIAGAEAGRGRPAVAGERFAIILDDCAPGASAYGGKEPLSTGAWLDPAAAQARLKPYDFRRPDRFTARSLGALGSIHRRVAETLAALDPELSGLGLALVDQLTWGEWLDSRGGGQGELFRSAMDRPRRPYERESPSRRRGSPFVQPERPRFRQPPEFCEEVGFWARAEESRLSDHLIFAAPAGFERIPDGGSILEALRSGWKLLADSSFAPAELLPKAPVVELSPDHRSFAGDGRGLLRDELVVLVRLQGGEKSLDLVYSSRAMEAFAGTLDRYGRYDLGA